MKHCVFVSECAVNVQKVEENNNNTSKERDRKQIAPEFRYACRWSGGGGSSVHCTAIKEDKEENVCNNSMSIYECCCAW